MIAEIFVFLTNKLQHIKHRQSHNYMKAVSEGSLYLFFKCGEILYQNSCSKRNAIKCKTLTQDTKLFEDYLLLNLY